MNRVERNIKMLKYRCTPIRNETISSVLLWETGQHKKTLFGLLNWRIIASSFPARGIKNKAETYLFMRSFTTAACMQEALRCPFYEPSQVKIVQKFKTSKVGKFWVNFLAFFARRLHNKPLATRLHAPSGKICHNPCKRRYLRER